MIICDKCKTEIKQRIAPWISFQIFNKIANGSSLSERTSTHELCKKCFDDIFYVDNLKIKFHFETGEIENG